MNEVTAAYFESINPLTRKIAKETRLVQVLFGEKWEQFEDGKKDAILDDYFVHPDVREKYQECEKQECYPISYPVLKVQMGEKIVVDEANDFWTWQDEFSGPFSWKTKSQQDLTLLDLEPEQMTKQSKTRRRGSKDLSEEASRKAPREFCVQDQGSSLWNSEFKNLKNIRLPQLKDHAISQPVITKFKGENSPEEVNYAFKRDSLIDTYIYNGNDKQEVSDNNITIKEEFSVDEEYSKRKPDIEMSVFENPMISHVIDDEESTSSTTTSPSHHPLLKSLKMSNMSPTRKPLLKAESLDSSNSGKSEGYEPEQHIPDYTDRNGDRNDDKTHLVSDVDYEDTELIAVDIGTGGSVLSDSRASVTSTGLLRTGFDFLDQW